MSGEHHGTPTTRARPLLQAMNTQGNQSVVVTTTVTPAVHQDANSGRHFVCKPWHGLFFFWFLTLYCLLSAVGPAKLSASMLFVFIIAVGCCVIFSCQRRAGEGERNEARVTSARLGTLNLGALRRQINGQQHDRSTSTAVADRETRRTLLHYFHLRPASAESRGLECDTSGSKTVLESEKVDEEGGAPSSCIICFGDFASGEELCRLPCFHLYHAQCIDEWLDGANHHWCPLCKTDAFAAAAAIRPATGSSSGTITNTRSTTPVPITPNQEASDDAV